MKSASHHSRRHAHLKEYWPLIAPVLTAALATPASQFATARAALNTEWHAFMGISFASSPS